MSWEHVSCPLSLTGAERFPPLSILQFLIRWCTARGGFFGLRWYADSRAHILAIFTLSKWTFLLNGFSLCFFHLFLKSAHFQCGWTYEVFMRRLENEQGYAELRLSLRLCWSKTILSALLGQPCREVLQESTLCLIADGCRFSSDHMPPLHFSECLKEKMTYFLMCCSFLQFPTSIYLWQSVAYGSNDCAYSEQVNPLFSHHMMRLFLRHFPSTSGRDHLRLKPAVYPLLA